jgi:hypothetical protein
LVILGSWDQNVDGVFSLNKTDDNDADEDDGANDDDDAI